MPVKKEILYPIFLSCCQYTKDAFWEIIFEDLAYGKAPYGTYISKDFLCCNYKNKEFSYKIDNNDAKKIYDDIYNLLTTKLCLLSHKEKLKKRLDFHTIENSMKEERQNWKDIKKKNIKDILIEKYALKMKEQYSLTYNQVKYLLSIISISMIFKVITSKDINYKNEKIESINGITFDTNKIFFDKNIYETENTFKPIITIDSKTMYETWEKHLTYLQS